jgi:hypothetical protein
MRSNKGTLYVGGDVTPMRGWRLQQRGKQEIERGLHARKEREVERVPC